MPRKVLIVEDDKNIADLMRLYLEKESMDCQVANDGLVGLEKFQQFQPDLVMLDIMLPGMDGWSICRKIRETSKVPIIMLTAKGELEDKVNGLELGADDYITKPFSLAVLRARVAARLRGGAKPAAGALALGPFTFDFERMDFRRAGAAIELSKAEQKLLRVLVENRGHAVSRAMLVDRVWTDGAQFVEENALSVTVRRLRGKLEADPARPEYLKTVYGIGYTWAVTP